MVACYRQLDMIRIFTAAEQVKCDMSVFVISNIFRAVIKTSVCSVCHDIAGKTFVYLGIIFNLGIDNKSSVFRKQFRKLMKWMTNIFQIFEEIEVILFDIKDYADFWEEMKKTVRIFTCFRNKRTWISDTDISSDRLQNTSDWNRRVEISFQ